MTDRQLKVLRQLAEKGNLAHYMPYMGRFNPGEYWFLRSTHERVTREIRRLKELGLVDVVYEDEFGDRATATISHKGRATLRKEPSNAP